MHTEYNRAMTRLGAGVPTSKGEGREGRERRGWREGKGMGGEGGLAMYAFP